MSGNNRMRLGRIGVIGSAGALFAVTALMMLVPVTTATSAAIVLSHPYYSLGASIQSSNSKSGCGKYQQMIAPKWDKKTGVFRAAGAAHATNCNSPVVGNTGEWYTYLTLEKYLKFTTAGTHNVNISFVVNDAASWNVTPFTTCTLNYKAAFSDCLVSSEVEVYTYTYIFDETNFSYSMGFTTLTTNFTTIENYSQNPCGASSPCPSGTNYTFGASGTSSGSMNGYTNFSTASAPIVTTDTYELEMSVLVLAVAQVDVESAKATGHGAAAASVDLGSAGRGIQVSSIVIH
jgi:hypothetical protein